MKKRRFLLPTDFSSASNKALDHALVLAHKYDAELIMLHVEVPHTHDPHNPKKEFPDLDELFAFIRQHVAGRVDDDSLPVIQGTVAIREEVRRSISDATEILDFIEQESIDLVIMGTHGRGALKSFVLGSTTDKVIRGSLAPVLTIHKGEDLLITNQGKYNKILAPVDFSDASRESLQLAVNLATKFGSELIVFHVFEPVLSAPGFFSDSPTMTNIDPDLKARSIDALKKFAGDILPGGTPFELSSGRAHREISDYANKHGVDLIVIANQGWNALDQFLLGGTTEKLIRKSPVPVMVKPFAPDEHPAW
jgi:nucleotide-binding universal stress UspA family protein